MMVMLMIIILKTKINEVYFFIFSVNYFSKIFNNCGNKTKPLKTKKNSTKINDKYSYKISSNYNNFRRTEHIR